MRKILSIAAILLLLAACAETSADETGELAISAASSLTDALFAAEKEFQRTHPEVDLSFNFGSSGKLRNQIQQGAPVDLFLSASEKDMEILQQDGLVSEEEVRHFAENRLVLASAEQLQETDLKTLLANSELIAVGEPESVPVGFYTKEALSRIGIWESLESQLIFAKDARQVLSYIESGNAEMGIIYSSDAELSTRLKTVIDLPKGDTEIVYPAGILTGAENKEAAKEFMDFLTSKEGRKIVEDYGFSSFQGDLH